MFKLYSGVSAPSCRVLTLSDELPVRVDADVEAGHHGLLAGRPQQPRLGLAPTVVGQHPRQRRHRVRYLPQLVDVLFKGYKIKITLKIIKIVLFLRH